MTIHVNRTQIIQKGRASMYARMITIQYQPDKMEEGLQMYQEVLAAAGQQPGFKGILGLIDREASKAMSITLWETVGEAQASGTGSAYFQTQMTRFASVLAAAPVIEVYEVVAQA